MKPVSSLSADTLKQAEEFANEILYPPSKETIDKPARDIIVIHDYHPWWYWPSRGCCDWDSSSQTKNKSDNKNGLVAAAIAVVVTTAYFLGSEFGALCNASNRKESIENRKIVLKKETGNPQIHEVLNLQGKMLDSMESGAMRGVILKTALIASAILFGTVAWAKSDAELVINGGIAASLALGGALTFRLGYSEADTSLKEDALQLLKAVKA